METEGEKGDRLPTSIGEIMFVRSYEYFIMLDGETLSRRAGFESEQAARNSAEDWLSNERLDTMIRERAMISVR